MGQEERFNEFIAKQIFDDLIVNSVPYIGDEGVFVCIRAKTFKKLRNKYTEVKQDVSTNKS